MKKCMSTASTPAVQTLFALCVAAWNTGVLAAPESTISLPQQSLEKSLAQLSRETGVGILAPGDLVANRTVGPVTGHFSVSEALSRLLQGTGLLAEKQDEKTWVIRGASPPKPVPAAPRNDGSTVLPDINVTAGKEPSSDGFVAYSTSSATRSDTPLSDLAQSVQVVTQDVMKSQQAQSVKDVLSNVSGVTVAEGTTSPVYIRGFEASVLNDGLGGIRGNIANGYSTPTNGVERVEVLKGADSILSGAMQPGGVVNIVKKRPQAEPVRALTVQTGSYGDWQTSLDLAGAVTGDKKLTYRFVISAERVGQDFLGRDGKRDFYVAPSVGWKSGGTTLIVGMEQHTARIPRTAFTFLTRSGPIPLASAIGSPSDHVTVNDTAFHYDFEQKFNGILTFHSKARYDAYSSNGVQYMVVTPSAGAGGFRTRYRWSGGNTQFYITTTDNNLTAKFRTGAIRHELQAGWSYSVARYNTLTIASVRDFTGPVPTSQFPGPSAPYFKSRTIANTYSSMGYVQDQVAWGPLHLSASLSRNQAWTNTASRDQSIGWTPNFGLLWQITENVGLYGNVLRSFVPQTQLLSSGGIAPPSKGRSFEVGLKLSALDDRLTGSVSVFRNAVTNQTFSDPNNPGFFLLSSGSVSRGIELDLTGRILPGWNIISSYTYTSMVDKSSSDGIGALPRHVASLWTTYDLQGESFRGWGGGVGIWARSNYVASSSGGARYRLPGQARTDASIYYHTKRWGATLGVKNVFNRTLYGEHASTDFVEIAPTRLFYLTANYNF